MITSKVAMIETPEPGLRKVLVLTPPAARKMIFNAPEKEASLKGNH